MIGAFFILDDPIFNGLAISLIFGILVSTALTLLLIPLLYLRLHQALPRGRSPLTGGISWHTSSSSALDSAAYRAAFDCASSSAKSHRVTLIGARPYFEFTPSNPWIAVGWRTPEETRVAMQAPLESKGIQWLVNTVTHDRCRRLAAHARRRQGTRLRLPRHRDRSAARLRRSAGPRPGRASRSRSAARITRRRRGARYQDFLKNPGPDRRRCCAGRELLRSRLRNRDDHRCGPAQAQASRPGPDDLRDERAVHRPHGSGRRRATARA